MLALFALTLPLSLHAQDVERDVSVQSQETARLDGFSYQEGPESHLAFHGTPIALAASGEAEVEFQDGRARVDVDVKKLPKVSSLGPFATYVLWAVTADGNANNLGSIDVKDGNGSARGDDSAGAVCVDRERGAALRGHRPEPRDRVAEPRQGRERQEVRHHRIQGTH